MTDTNVVIKCPAKINLTLKITGKRDDGFHEIESLMCPLDFHDELHVRCERGERWIELTCSDPTIPTGPDNLVHKAATLFMDWLKTDLHASFHIEKRIPAGGGLAGGSSNAVSALIALNRIMGEPLQVNDLHAIAARLGSDLNFFLVGGPALCKGRGEIVEPASLSCPPRVLLINPGFGVPTPWAYKTYAAHPTSGEPGRLIIHINNQQEFLRNDLEPPVFTKYLWIAEAKRWLLAQPEVADAMMSGSGATVFALLREDLPLDGLAQRVQAHFGEAAWIREARIIQS